MRVRRRSALLSAAFLTLATLTAGPTAVTAQPPPPPGLQPPGRFTLPQEPPEFPPGFPGLLPQRGGKVTALADGLTPEQIRTALLRLSGPGGDVPKDLESFADAIKQKVLQQAPNADPTLIDNQLRKIINDPARMQQLRDIASKQAADGGKTPAAADLSKMFRNLPNEIPGLPKDFGKQVGRQFRDGLPQPAPPPAPTPGLAPPAAGRPAILPKSVDVPPAPDPGKADPPRAAPEVPPTAPQANEAQRPPDPFEQTPQDKARGKALRTLAGAWERNIGPLNETPAVQRALAELVTGAGDLKDADGNSIWDSFDKQLGDGEGFANWIDKASFGENFQMPTINWPSFNWGGSNIGGGSASSRESWWNRSSGSRSSSGSRGGFGVPGLEGTWLPVVLLAAVLLGALVWWRFVYLRDPARQSADLAFAGLGPWPLDPRRIASRDDVVRAFEYLSVLICGPEAKTWTHATIAGALTGLARTHGEAAIMLARLYELARYAPLDEPLTPAELTEARRLVCGLAGVANA